MIAPDRAFPVDSYITDVLMRDLVGHDRTAAAFLVYLFLWRRTVGEKLQSVRLSHQDIADETGLSKSAVQQALRVLHRRTLVKSRRRHRTDVPEHSVVRTWVREKSRSAS